MSIQLKVMIEGRVRLSVPVLEGGIVRAVELAQQRLSMVHEPRSIAIISEQDGYTRIWWRRSCH